MSPRSLAESGVVSVCTVPYIEARTTTLIIFQDEKIQRLFFHAVYSTYCSESIEIFDKEHQNLPLYSTINSFMHEYIIINYNDHKYKSCHVSEPALAHFVWLTPGRVCASTEVLGMYLSQ